MAHLLVMSDLHLEFERSGPRKPTGEWFRLREARSRAQGHPIVGPYLGHLVGEQLDLVVLAGDIDLDDAGIAYADQVALYLGVPVVTVMGNHEAYSGHDLSLLIPKLRNAARATQGRVTFLENETATFETAGGERFHVLGATLWTDYALNGADDVSIAHSMNEAQGSLNDHARILLRGSRFSTMGAKGLHEASRKWLGRAVTETRAADPDGKVVIVTHHAPIPDANPPQYRGGILGPAFTSDMRAEIEAWQPDAWIWGHTHYSMEDRQGKTLLLSSQRGYIGGEEPGASSFVPAIVEI